LDLLGSFLRRCGFWPDQPFGGGADAQKGYAHAPPRFIIACRRLMELFLAYLRDSVWQTDSSRSIEEIPEFKLLRDCLSFSFFGLDFFF
jgi:hypothetical protein